MVKPLVLAIENSAGFNCFHKTVDVYVIVSGSHFSKLHIYRITTFLEWHIRLTKVISLI